jgi:hypothetical protein
MKKKQIPFVHLRRDSGSPVLQISPPGTFPHRRVFGDSQAPPHVSYAAAAFGQARDGTARFRISTKNRPFRSLIQSHLRPQE